jgi:hypothetical protein
MESFKNFIPKKTFVTRDGVEEEISATDVNLYKIY